MKIADFFVDLGVTGAIGLKDALTATEGKLKSLGDMSWQAKAGIFGAVLAMEELTRHAVGSAVDLRNFAGATGLSTERLQELQYMAEMNHVSGQELTKTIYGLQDAQAALAVGEGIPKGAVWFGLDQSQNPEQMLEQIRKKIREVANDQRQIGLARSMAATLGIGPDMFAAFRLGNFSLAGFRREMLLTAQEQKRLLALDQTWSRFWWDIKHESEKVIADDLAAPITGAVKMMHDAADGAKDVLDKLNVVLTSSHLDASKMPKTFEVLAGAIGGFVAIVNPWIGIIIALGAALADIHRFLQGEDSIIGNIQKWGRENLPSDAELSAKLQSLMTVPFSNASPNAFVGPPSAMQAYMDTIGATPGPNAGPATQQNHIEINLNQPVRDPGIAQAIGRGAVAGALDQIPQPPKGKK